MKCSCNLHRTAMWQFYFLSQALWKHPAHLSVDKAVNVSKEHTPNIRPVFCVQTSLSSAWLSPHPEDFWDNYSKLQTCLLSELVCCIMVLAEIQDGGRKGLCSRWAVLQGGLWCIVRCLERDRNYTVQSQLRNENWWNSTEHCEHTDCVLLVGTVRQLYGYQP